MTVLNPQRTHVENHLIHQWTDEHIWGHRFHNEQTPWIVLLEFLAVFRSRWSAGYALNEPREPGEHEQVRYDIPRAAHLRYLIFNNPHLQHIEQTVSGDEARWRRWREAVASAPFDERFDYLQQRFGEFSRFVRAVEFFQTTALEQHREQRRWTSRFLFPYGPDCLFADVRPDKATGGLGGVDRLFFARAGELLYLMLNRSGRGAELASAIAEKLMRPDDRWNRLARALQPDGIPPDRNPVTGQNVGYLPEAERPEYAELARDWAALLATEMPGASVLDPLMRVSALHIIRYILRRGQEEIGEAGPPRLVLEIATPRKTLLFELSRESHDANRALPRRALESHIEATRRTAGWTQALAENDPALAAFAHLQRTFRWRRREPPGGGPEEILRVFREGALSGHDEHMGKVVPQWSREIGLAVSRRGLGTWYSPDDAFLKALVMTSVSGREEYHRFLERLYERYGLVIGVAEAERAYGGLPTDERVFVDNAARLEQRLRTLGLLHRLSDDCAYVTNPFKAALQ